jgi:hypothetical protein
MLFRIAGMSSKVPIATTHKKVISKTAVVRASNLKTKGESFFLQWTIGAERDIRLLS